MRIPPRKPIEPKARRCACSTPHFMKWLKAYPVVSSRDTLARRGGRGGRLAQDCHGKCGFDTAGTNRMTRHAFLSSAICVR